MSILIKFQESIMLKEKLGLYEDVHFQDQILVFSLFSKGNNHLLEIRLLETGFLSRF
jgi:hypothetical protein